MYTTHGYANLCRHNTTYGIQICVGTALHMGMQICVGTIYSIMHSTNSHGQSANIPYISMAALYMVCKHNIL